MVELQRLKSQDKLQGRKENVAKVVQLTSSENLLVMTQIGSKFMMQSMQTKASDISY